MMRSDEFTVQVPLEVLEDWIKSRGVQADMVMEHQEITIDNIKLNTETNYLEIEGDLWTREDA